MFKHLIRYKDFYNKAKMQVAQDQFIQKKLLYKYDKKIQSLFQSLFALAQSSQPSQKMVDESEEGDKKLKYMSKKAMLQQLDLLQFQNFKYRAALISAKKDQTSNEEILKKSQQQIQVAKQEVQELSRQLEQALICKRNMQGYNQLAESLKSGFEPLSVQQQKLSTVTREIEEMEQKYKREISDFEKKEKCLRLALSALKCIVDIDQREPENNNSTSSLYLNPSLLSESEGKISYAGLNGHHSFNNQYNESGREEGEQLEGGQIRY